MLGQGVVSIPHRYGKNKMSTHENKKAGLLVSIPHRYGKNDGWNSERGCFWPFPFLIGTVRTAPGRESGVYVPYVSIPHRYGKNFLVNWIIKRLRGGVSIPHRYGKN